MFGVPPNTLPMAVYMFTNIMLLGFIAFIVIQIKFRWV